jgi:heme exporter protein D
MSVLTHWHFVALSYGFAALVVVSAIVAVWADYRAQLRAIARLEAQGIRRRSDATAPAGAGVPVLRTAR